MRRTAALLLLVLTFSGCAFDTSRGNSPDSSLGNASAPTETSHATAVGSPSDIAPAGRTTEGDVVRVVDGDTIDVEITGRKYRVRYIGIDAPETVKPSTPVQWMGPEASAANRRLVEGRHVVLEKDVSETDKYGRLLRYVWLHEDGIWTMVNLRLVELGYAASVSYPPDVRYQHLLLAAQSRARQAGAGLWGPQPGGTR